MLSRGVMGKRKGGFHGFMRDYRPLKFGHRVFQKAEALAGMLVKHGQQGPAVLAADLILGRDKRARRYIERYKQRQKQ